MDLFSTIETIKSKSQPVTEAMVLNAYKSVKRGGKSGGIDTFSYRTFRLNELVTFNDVVNFIEDKEKIITEPSVYIKGEDIKFHDNLNTTTTLTFIENTQTLRCIFINDIDNFEFVNSLRKSVFLQLGDPTWGFEKKFFHDIQENHIMSDHYTYDIRYEFIISGYKISINISHGGIRIINKVTNEQFDALSGQAFAWLKESYKLYG